MTQWEYRVVTLPSVEDRNDFVATANSLGREGWEIVNVTSGIAGGGDDKKWVSIVVCKRVVESP